MVGAAFCLAGLDILDDARRSRSIAEVALGLFHIACGLGMLGFVIVADGLSAG